MICYYNVSDANGELLHAMTQFIENTVSATLSDSDPPLHSYKIHTGFIMNDFIKFVASHRLSI